VLRQYEGVEFHAAPEQVEEIYRQWKKYWEDIEANKPVKVKYHW